MADSVLLQFSRPLIPATLSLSLTSPITSRVVAILSRRSGNMPIGCSSCTSRTARVRCLVRPAIYRAYRFVELGWGKVDLPAVFKALKEINFGGWAVVELDSVPDTSRTPKNSAVISRKYLEEKLRLKI